MTTTIVTFAGGMASGKDTYANALAAHFKNPTTVAFADSLKEEINTIIKHTDHPLSTDEVYAMAKDLDVDISDLIIVLANINRLKVKCKRQGLSDDISANMRHEDMRHILQFWGTDVRRKQDDNYWIRKTIVKIGQLSHDHDLIVVSDARFLNEIEAIAAIDGSVIRLDVPLETRIERIIARDGFEPSKASLEHPSETDYLKYDKPTLVIDQTKTPNVEDGIKLILDVIKPRP